MGGPCLCRYWNDPEVLAKLGRAMGNTFDMPNMGIGEEQGEEEDPETLVAAASAGEALRSGHLTYE